MDSEILLEFIKQAEAHFGSIRGGILVCAQTGGRNGEINQARRQIRRIRQRATVAGLNEIAETCRRFEVNLQTAADAKAAFSDERARGLLDEFAELEAAVARLYFRADGFSGSVSGFVEDSFRQFEQNAAERKNFVQSAAGTDRFVIDHEMLEVFALEADQLARSIGANLEKLKTSPSDASALLEIRRSTHTIKGSAGIVGLKKLASLAHRVEDLLDHLATQRIGFDRRICELLSVAVECFEALARDDNSARVTENIARLYADFDRITTLCQPSKERNAVSFENQSIGGAPATALPAQPAENQPTGGLPNRAVVRVALDKLGDLVELTGDLAVNRIVFDEHLAEFEKQISELRAEAPQFARSVSRFDLLRSNFEALFENRYRLIEEMNDKLLRLRMVPFGSIFARLHRTVRVACEEEEKFAELIFDGETAEIDTQTLDSLIEPLLQLLRNAVAHGIEAPDLRRLLGKPEQGKISVRLRTENHGVTAIVSDDGRGISIDALKEKAAAGDFVSRRKAEQISDREALELIFLPGLTTAEKLSQIAGRGVGMNIVKNGIERCGGTISVDSEPHKGTCFTLCLPVNADAAKLFNRRDDNLPIADFSSGTSKSLPSDRQQTSVLIVDDSFSFRRAIVNLVRNVGWQFSEAGDGVEALEILRDGRKLPRVILTDAEMPRMNGYEFLAALGENSIFRRIPVIMLTSRAGKENRQRAFDAGASEYLTKPFDNLVLLNKIENLARSVR